MSRGLRGTIGWRLFGACVAAAVVGSLSACGSPLSSINPFKKEKARLPGERISVLTDPTLVNLDPGAMKPVSVPPPRANAAWTQPGGVASNNLGHLVLNDSLQKVWSTDVGTGSSSRGRLSAVPLVDGGKVYTLDAAGTVSAVSAANGAKVWSVNLTPKHEKSTEGFGGGLAIDGNRVYATTGFGIIVALDANNGSVLWNKQIHQPVRSSPTAAAGKLYFVSADNVLHALNGSDGSETWSSRGLPQVATLLSNVSPAVSSGIVIASFPAGDITAFSVGSGQAAWSDSLTPSTENSASGVLADPARPVIDRGVVFAVSHGGKMIAASETSGERQWSRNLASTQMPWVAGDAIYVVDLDGKLIALSRSDGSVRWVTELPQGARWAGPVAAGGKVWVVSGKGLLVGADARTGQLSTNVDLKTDVFVTPVVAGGRMYILADNATLIALN